MRRRHCPTLQRRFHSLTPKRGASIVGLVEHESWKGASANRRLQPRAGVSAVALTGKRSEAIKRSFALVPHEEKVTLQAKSRSKDGPGRTMALKQPSGMRRDRRPPGPQSNTWRAASS